MKKWLLFSLMVILVSIPAVQGFGASPSPSGTLLTEVERGSIVEFGGKKWIVVDPSEGKLLLHVDSMGSYFWGYSFRYNEYDGIRNSMYRYLNYETANGGSLTFYGNLGDEKDWIVPHYWDVRTDTGNVVYGDSEGKIFEKVGLLTLAEYKAYEKDPQLNIGESENGYYLLTPTDNSRVWTIDTYGLLTTRSESQLSSYSTGYRPVVYIRTDLYVSGGWGNDQDPYTLSELLITKTPATRTQTDVTVTIQYPGNSTDWTYQVGVTGNVYSYDTPFTMTENDTVYVTYTDGLTPKQAKFKIDSIDHTAPVISGVEEGASYETQVTPSSSDYDIQFVSLTKDHISVEGYTLGSMLLDNGAYELTAVDYAGNASSMRFTVNIPESSRLKLVSARTSIDGEVIELNFNKTLDSNYNLNNGQFRFYADGESLGFYASISSSSQSVKLYLDDPLPEGAALTVDMNAGVVTSAGMPVNPVSQYPVSDGIIRGGEDGKIDMVDIIGAILSKRDVDLDGVFDEYDMGRLLEIIETENEIWDPRGEYPEYPEDPEDPEFPFPGGV